MPKSSGAMTPPSSTRRLPGCGSAWKNPSSKICRSRIRAPVTATSAGSTPSARIPSRSLIATPSMNSMAITREVEYSS